tara:strand:- start:49049 stop:50665 length:1617 start_codon:yes stop_codon:yes gene_type:complete
VNNTPMKIVKRNVLLTGLLASVSLGVSAQESYTTSDVVGMFADQSFVGSEAGTKTVIEAHLICLGGSVGAGGESSISQLGNSSYDSDYSESYRDCMSKYVPFRVTGSDAAGACGSQDVSWGQCASTLPSSADGAVYSVRNTIDAETYEGVAAFQCENNNWKYLSGGCAKVANPCESGLITSWEVTTPLWADSSASTVYTDKFGQVRHNPKQGCYARMDAASSGELVTVRATSPETSPASSYNLSGSVAPKRCFNNEWLDEPSGGSTSCTYVPQNCSAQTYTHPNGCSYSIPSLNHDEVYNNTSPLPENSVGSLQAYCWDGQVEIKSASCNMSCDARVPVNYWSWDGASDEVNPKTCYHTAKFESERVAPNGIMSIDNETEGLKGTSFYTCSNGTMQLDAESCAPETCTSVPANSWTLNGKTCSHDAFVIDIAHGETIAKRPQDIGLGTLGEIVYQCKYGDLTVLSQTCEPAYDTSICYAEEVNPEDPEETIGDGYVPPATPPTLDRCEDTHGRLGYSYIGGQCCKDDGARGMICYEVP